MSGENIVKYKYQKENKCFVFNKVTKNIASIPESVVEFFT